ncbi:MAG: murein biosynthesis integral membrane protein MurJ [Desulfobacterales bacterium]|nr:murein biosynthesis integral membrane protein MurJ [Desulfobacterales bacterium]
MFRKIGFASLIMMASVFASRVIGLVREMVIASAGGASGHVDAYQIAFVLPEILNHVVASGFLSITFIPIFTRYLAAGDEEGGWRAFSLVMTVFGTFLVVMIAVAEIFAWDLVRLLAPGITDPVLLGAATHMTRIILPAQFFFFAGGLFMAVQFARERFAIAALAPLVYNLGIICGGLLLGGRLGMAGFAWGVLGGAFFGNFALQWIGARRAGLRFTPVFDLGHSDLRTYVRLTLPLMLGLTMLFSTEIFLKFFGSYLAEGGIAGLNYALRIMFILVALVGQAVGVASFPFMARLVVEDRIEEMSRLLDTLLRHLALVMPLSALFMVLRREIVVICYQRGRFDAGAVDLTTEALGWLMIGAVAFAAQTVVVRGFYAMQNTLLPSVLGTVAVLLSLPLYIIGLKAGGIAGVALACSLAAVIQAVLLYAIWNRRTGSPGGLTVWRTYLKTAMGSVVLGGLAWGVRQALIVWIEPAGAAGSLVVAAGTGAVFCLLLVVAARRLGIEGFDAVAGRLRARWVRRAQPSSQG